MNWRKRKPGDGPARRSVTPDVRKPDWADAPSARSESERVDELLRAVTAINVRMARGG